MDDWKDLLDPYYLVILPNKQHITANVFNFKY